MIQEFVNTFMAKKAELKVIFEEKRPEDYQEIVKAVITILSDNEDYGSPDPERIHLIDDGEYQGTLIFIIAAKRYQPDDYWYVKVGYGSCSGCDTLAAINSQRYDSPHPQQVADYMALALHIVQGLKKMGEDVV